MKCNYITNIQFLNSENKSKINKKRIDSIIFTRSICTIGIVIFHYFCHSHGKFKFLFRTSNSTFGFLFVISFFCISGAVLFYNYPKIKAIKGFFFKRWKHIFPSFYLCYLYFFLRYSFSHKKIYFKWNIFKLFITLIGLDGYLLYKFKTCYLVGEWFLGAIIIIYTFYPLLSLILNYSGFFCNIFVWILNVFMYKTNFFIISKTRNIITCLTSFYFGIITIKYRRFFFENKILLIISFFIFLFLSIIKFPDITLFCQVQGFSLFIILVNFGKYIMQTKMNKLFNEIDKLSYYIYLYHHQIIYDILSVNNPYQWYYHLIQISIVIILTIVCSKIHLMVLNSVFTSGIFKKIESIFIEI